MKNITIRKRTADFMETANSWQEYYDIGHQIAETGKLIRRMSMHMADLQKKVDSQAEELKRRQNNNWIPCSERLPEDKQDVIFTAPNGMVFAGMYDAKEKGCVSREFLPNAFDIIAWMPLPEPYKEGNE